MNPINYQSYKISYKNFKIQFIVGLRNNYDSSNLENKNGVTCWSLKTNRAMYLVVIQEKELSPISEVKKIILSAKDSLNKIIFKKEILDNKFFFEGTITWSQFLKKNHTFLERHFYAYEKYLVTCTCLSSDIHFFKTEEAVVFFNSIRHDLELAHQNIDGQGSRNKSTGAQ